MAQLMYCINRRPPARCYSDAVATPDQSHLAALFSVGKSFVRPNACWSEPCDLLHTLITWFQVRYNLICINLWINGKICEVSSKLAHNLLQRCAILLSTDALEGTWEESQCWSSLLGPTPVFGGGFCGQPCSSIRMVNQNLHQYHPPNNINGILSTWVSRLPTPTGMD